MATMSLQTELQTLRQHASRINKDALMLVIDEAEAAAAAETTPDRMERLVSDIAAGFGTIMTHCVARENQAIRLSAKIDWLRED